MRRLVVLIGLCLGLFPVAAGAQEATTLRVSQAYVDVPDITVFFGARDASGQFVSPVRSEQVSVSAGATEMTVDTVTTFSDANRGVAYIFLADVSKSMRPDQYQRVRGALDTWVGRMDPQDQAALLTFGSAVEVVQDFTSDTEALQTRVDSLRPTDDRTKLHSALARSLKLGRRRDSDLPTRRVIVILSDGKDDVTGGMTEREVRERMRVDRTPIYAIGYARPPVTGEKEASLDKLGTFARASGGQFVEAGSESIASSFENLRARIEEVHVGQLTCTACEPDGTVRRLQVQLTSGPNTMTGGVQVRMQSTTASETTAESEPKTTMQTITAFFSQLPWWGYGSGALLLVALAAGIYAFVREGDFVRGGDFVREEDKEEPEPEPSPQPMPSLKGDSTKQKTPEPKEPKGIPLRFEVVGRQGGGAHKAHIADRIVVGRSRDCDVVVSGDKEASRKNSEVVREDGELYVRDLNSRNGTLVNGVPISGSYRLEDGDRILVGRTELRIDIPDELKGPR